MKLVYPQNDKVGILEVFKIKTSFIAQLWWTDLLRIFVKFCKFYAGGIYVRLLKKVKTL